MSLRYLFLIFLTGLWLTTPLIHSAQAQNNTVTTPLEIDNDEFDDDFDVDEDWDVYDEPKEIDDPLLGYNQFMFKVNDKIYRKIFNPITYVYDFIIPKRIQLGIDNIFENLQMPKRTINNIFQGKFKDAATETGRFVVNSTVGIAGFLILLNPN